MIFVFTMKNYSSVDLKKKWKILFALNLKASDKAPPLVIHGWRIKSGAYLVFLMRLEPKEPSPYKSY